MVVLKHDWPRGWAKATSTERRVLMDAEHRATQEALQARIIELWDDSGSLNLPECPRLHVAKKRVRWGRGYRRLWVRTQVWLSDGSYSEWKWKSAPLR